MKKFLGIDVGSITAKAVLVDEDGKIIDSGYSFHNGKPAETLKAITSSFDLEDLAGAARTSSTPEIIKGAFESDIIVSFIKGASAFYSNMRALLITGGEKSGIVFFDEAGKYLNYKANSSCAAGTGSFLDQQARRLELSCIEEFCRKALLNNEEIPAIASRCAVFAKTALIHAQHEGYLLSQICDGLAYGLARNIVDTFLNNTIPEFPIIFAGGVAKNSAVIKHLELILETEIITNDFSHLYGALGSAYTALEEHRNTQGFGSEGFSEIFNIVEQEVEEGEYLYPPLRLNLSKYPDFDSEKSYIYEPQLSNSVPVEVDIYEPIENQKTYQIVIGIDIGSTSTKATLLDFNSKKVLAGFYTRTSGRPIEAVKGIFETVEETASESGAFFEFTGAATTGSGRRFIGRVVGADLMLDEISAHARAAYELDSEVDTILEIGGQDSKFTTLREGRVTFTAMNNACAAGTGSFIEEQAARLGCSLDQYNQEAEGIPSPMASDRCTVFMERDINYFLSKKHSVREVLAAALHSVRDNYLTKVATEKNIGSKVFFQGATAKNRALVAAFEQRLERPIMVSKYCHLTGAYGAALSLMETHISSTKFRGTGLCRIETPVTSETCTLCSNNCKTKVVQIGNEVEAFGFLCGRDYETKKFVMSREEKYDFVKRRKKEFSVKQTASEGKTVGLPSALYLAEEFPFWKQFFDLLSIKTVSGEECNDAVKRGKNIAGAEFCAPIAASYGQLDYLYAKADYIFMPYYIEERNERGFSIKNQYCYYSQFAASLAVTVPNISKERLLSPMFKSMRSSFYGKYELFKSIKKVQPSLRYNKMISAYKEALKFYEEKLSKMQEIYEKETADSDDIHVVLAGRPYLILPDEMNNAVPELFARQGVNVFYSADIPSAFNEELEPISPLLSAFYWVYASKVLEAAFHTVKTEGAYPVLVTSFKCSPDSFTVEYFKMMMDCYSKPYLILQLDEHDSSIGYETRVESAVRAFRNHFQLDKKRPQIVPLSGVDEGIILKPSDLEDKTLLFPNWDSLTCRLHVANIRSQGIDARILEEIPEYIRKSMIHNTGQCIPLNVIAQEVMEYVKNHNLDPAKTALWLVKTTLSCNLGMFPYFIKNILNTHKKGMEKISVYKGTILFSDFSISTAVNGYFANYFGGMLRKAACAIRPYEVNKGETDRVTEQAVEIIANAMESGGNLEESTSKVVNLFASIEKSGSRRPKVGVFGDLYTRYNEVINQNLFKLIEDNGGEVVVTSPSELLKLTADSYIRKMLYEGIYGKSALASVLIKILPTLEKRYDKIFSRIISVEDKALPLPPSEVLNKFGVRLEHTGESMENLLKTYALAANEPDLVLFVQANPAFCCPSLVTQAMSEKIEEVTGIPVVTVEYDGTAGYKNDPIIPYLKLRAGKRKRNSKEAHPPFAY